MGAQWSVHVVAMIVLLAHATSTAALVINQVQCRHRCSRRRQRVAVPAGMTATPLNGAEPPRRVASAPSLIQSEGGGFVFGTDALQAVVDRFRTGGLVLLSEDGDEETGVSLMMAPQAATEEQMEFLQEHAKRLQVAFEPEAYEKLLRSIRKIVLDNKDPALPSFSVSLNGLSRSFRNATAVAETVRSLSSEDLAAGGDHAYRCPGAVRIACSRVGGVLRRAGATEAAIELAKLAGLPPVGLHAPLRHGGLAALRHAAGEWGIPYASTADVVAYARRHTVLVERSAPPARMPTKHGLFMAHCYRSRIDGTEHMALVKSDSTDPFKPFTTSRAALVRAHSECCTGDVFGSLRCDCGPQLEQALKTINADGYGVLLYLRGQEGRGIGLGAKMHAYSLQERGLDTMDANTELGLPVDSREYGTGAQILADLGIRDMRLISNNPKKFSGLAGYGLRIVERVPSHIAPNPENLAYLKTKVERMGHLLDLETAVPASVSAPTRISRNGASKKDAPHPTEVNGFDTQGSSEDSRSAQD